MTDLAAAASAIEAFLLALGHPTDSDPELAQTGRAVAQAYAEELLSGYAMDPAVILAERLPSEGSELVVVANLDVTSMCPHHLLPAYGKLSLGYAPNGHIVGLGALANIADCFSRRLILQETMCQAIVDALLKHLGASAAFCMARMTQGCMRARGGRRHDANVVTLASAGPRTAAYQPAFLAAINQ
jgi:GTP cyclohydrolase IA